MLLYNLSDKITAFTTHREEARDGESIRKALGLPVGIFRFAYPHQTHTDRVLRIKDEFFTLSDDERKSMMEGVDAIISNVRCACLGISTADCIPVIVYDPVHHAAAAIHAGWKGTVKRIVQNALNAMRTEFGTHPEQCRCVIGPGISQESFEVGQEVVDVFTAEGFCMERYVVMLPLTKPQPSMSETHRPHIDLKAINKEQLTEMGVREENIEVSSIDTFTDTSFFSARREQKGDVKCGRILTGFWLK